MTLQFIIVMIASAINDRLQRKLDYVEEERRTLKEQLDAVSGGEKLSFTIDQRRRPANAGNLLSPDERQVLPASRTRGKEAADRIFDHDYHGRFFRTRPDSGQQKSP